MEARDLLPYRTPLIGAAVALAIGALGGLTMRLGEQGAPEPQAYATNDTQYAEAEPIAWPSGKIPDWVIGTDFLRAQRMDQPPVVVASEPIPEYVAPIAWHEPEPQPEAERVRVVQAEERDWPSTSGDILDTRLPEERAETATPPTAVEPSQSVAVAALN